MLIFVLLTFWLAACTDIRPVAKIGLLAPFEGLYRRSGYEALAAMRQAIGDSPAGQIGFIPLALDDSADPQRTLRSTQKLLVDNQVRAVVGPLSPALATTSGQFLENSAVPWFAPYAVQPAGGFADPLASEQWAAGLIAAAGAAAQRQGAASLVLAGGADGWPAWDDARWSAEAGAPVRTLSTDPGAIDSIRSDEAIFWLGAADAAAAFLATLPPRLDAIPFWLGPAGGDPVLAERVEIDRKLYWLAWSNVHYNDWAASHSPSTPSAFLVYEATRAAIASVTGAAPASDTPWHVELFELADGVSRLYTP